MGQIRGALREERLVVDDRILTNCINDLRGSNK